jgi:hypothetical protein
LYVGAQITVASQRHGIVMVMMTVEMDLMNRQSTASLKVGHALVICSHAIMETVFLVSISVMAIMIASTARMKMRGISAVSNIIIGTFSWMNSVSSSWQCVNPIIVIQISHFFPGTGI